MTTHQQLAATIARDEKRRDGGPAFPCEETVTWQEDVQITDPEATAFGETRTVTKSTTERRPGMSLRAWLAGMAMQGMYACYDLVENDGTRRKTFTHADIARMACEQADALIAELEKSHA